MGATTDNPRLFELVKEGVDIVEAARRYGLEPDRRGWCRCPFHGEKTPSFHLYRQRYHCFGCGASGDVVDLVAGLLNLKPLEAVKELNVRFGLGIDLEAPVDTADLAQARVERRAREQLKRWREAALGTLTGRYRALHLAQVHDAPTEPGKAPSDRYADAVKELDRLEYYLDFLSYGSEAEIKAAMPDMQLILQKLRGEAEGYGQRGA